MHPAQRILGDHFLRRESWIGYNFVFAPAVSLLFIYFAFVRRSKPYRFPGTWLPVWGYALLALVVLNVLCPYLGLKTENSFAMFSNVLTEGDIAHWNSLILPQSMRVFHFEDHLVVVKSVRLVDTVDPADAPDAEDVASAADSGNAPGLPELRPDDRFQLVEFEFRRNVAMACHHYKQPIEIDYEIDGVPHHVADAHKVPELANGNGYLLEKLLYFRKVPNSPYGICLH
jgi:hypothetical protein